MKKSLIVIIIIAIVVIVAKFTVPQPEKHRQVAQQKLMTLVGQKLSTVQGLTDIAQGDDFDLAALINIALDQIEVKDYFVCNVGKITYDGSTYPLTVGVFNRVFVLTDYQDAIQNAGKKVDEYKKKFE